jgi:hypothetical protein
MKSPPPPSSPPPPPSRRNRAAKPPASGTGGLPSDDEVYDLGPADDVADESERAQAIQEVVELVARRKPSPGEDEPDAPVLELTTSEPVDEAEIEKTIREVVELPEPPSAKPVGREKEPPLAAILKTGDPADDLEKAEAIRAVVEGAVRFTREVAAAKPMQSYRSRPIVLAAIAVPCLALALFTSLARPQWVFGPNPAAASTAQREAHIRFAMFLVAQRLYAYRDANQGQLPRSLLEIGEEWPGLIYTNLGGSVFELRSIDSLVPPISFRSDGDERALLGQSRTYLRERPTP